MVQDAYMAQDNRRFNSDYTEFERSTSLKAIIIGEQIVFYLCRSTKDRRLHD
jgi:hypothetical protein